MKLATDVRRMSSSRKMSTRHLTAGLLAASLALIGFNIISTVGGVKIEPCSENFRMTNTLKAIFPSVQFGAPQKSFCESPGFVGVDTAGIFIFGEDADVSSLSFGPLDDVPEGVPIERFDHLYPDAGLAAALDYQAAYGFSIKYNSGAYVVRRTDGTGPVMVMVADLM